MKARYVAIILIAASAAVPALSQSGRRSAATPAPTPLVSEPGQYSESKPRTTRTTQYENRFPANSSRKEEKKPVTPPISEIVGDEDTIRVDTNLITIPVSVFDRNGLYIPGIRQEEFKIFEDGVEQDIAYFATTDKPITVALVLDTSPSTQYRIEEIHQAAIAFVNQLKPEDTVIVIEFYHKVKVQTKATKDREKIYAGIRRAKFGEGTSLYNAVDEALRKQLSKIPGRKAVVLFTDGVDTTSQKNSYDGTISYAEESDSLVFPIYYNTFLDNRRRVSGWPDIFGGMVVTTGVSAEDYAVGRRYLNELADVTGGRVFRPESTPGGLTRAFEGIAEELRRQYNIGYVPTTEGTRGQRKQIKVRVQRPNLVLRARDSYIVGSTVAVPAPSPTPAK